MVDWLLHTTHYMITNGDVIPFNYRIKTPFIAFIPNGHV